jgi:hypothetical protein
MSTVLNDSSADVTTARLQKSTTPVVAAAGFGLFVAVVVISELFYAEEVERLVAQTGFRGLGRFLWVFIFLCLALETWRQRILADILRTRDVMRAVASGELRSAILIDVYTEEQAYAELLSRLPSEMNGRVRCAWQMLAARCDRLADAVEEFERIGAGLAAQVGLMGTFLGLAAALNTIAAGLKNVAGGGGVLQALADSGLATKFSASLAAAVVVAAVSVLAAGPREATRSLKRQLAMCGPSTRQGEQPAAAEVWS